MKALVIWLIILSYGCSDFSAASFEGCNTVEATYNDEYCPADTWETTCALPLGAPRNRGICNAPGAAEVSRVWCCQW